MEDLQTGKLTGTKTSRAPPNNVITIKGGTLLQNQSQGPVTSANTSTAVQRLRPPLRIFTCFFCKARLSYPQFLVMKRSFTPELYGNVFRKGCTIINSTHPIIEKRILTLPNDKVKSLINLCEVCRGLVFHLHRVLEDSGEKQRSIIQEEAMLTNNMLIFRILQGEKKVNLFPLAEQGPISRSSAHMHWEIKMREMECITSLSNPAVRAALRKGSALLTPFSNPARKLPTRLQQGHLTVNATGFDYTVLQNPSVPDDDDDDVQFIEEKPKSVEIKELDHLAYAELKAKAINHSTSVPAVNIAIPDTSVKAATQDPPLIPVITLNSNRKEEAVEEGRMKEIVKEVPEDIVAQLLKPPSTTKNTNTSGLGPPTKRQKMSTVKLTPTPVSDSTVTSTCTKIPMKNPVGVRPVTEDTEVKKLNSFGSFPRSKGLDEHEDSSNQSESKGSYNVEVAGSSVNYEYVYESSHDSSDDEMERNLPSPKSEVYEPTEEIEGSDTEMIPTRDVTGNYICDVCEKVFPTRNGLNGHVWIHRNPYCPLCRIFLRSGHEAEIHKRTLHNGTAPEKCHVCCKEFRDGQKLIIHLRGHRGEKTYSCAAPECDEQFLTKLECLKHLKLCPYAFHPPVSETRRKSRRASKNRPSTAAADDYCATADSNTGIELDFDNLGFTIEEVQEEDEEDIRKDEYGNEFEFEFEDSEINPLAV